MFNLIGKAHALAASDFSPISPISGNRGLKDIIASVVTTVLWFAGMLAVVYLIYGGILYITAGGDAEKATKGRTALVNAIIGIVIILLALVIVSYVKSVVK
ncbi:MAG: pilin [Patescibacteria group bacterium]|jgi:hypothetical protein